MILIRKLPRPPCGLSSELGNVISSWSKSRSLQSKFEVPYAFSAFLMSSFLCHTDLTHASFNPNERPIAVLPSPFSFRSIISIFTVKGIALHFPDNG